jgi:hypothetical protein
MLTESIIQELIFDKNQKISSAKLIKFNAKNSTKYTPEDIYLLLKGVPCGCKECGSSTHFKSFTIGYLEFCSTKCATINVDTRVKIEATCTERYGKKSLLHGDKSEMFLSTIGVINPFQSQIIKDKICATNIRKHGHRNPMQCPTIKARAIKTTNDRYGCDTPRQNKEINDKVISGFIEKYGVDNPAKTRECKEKSIETCLSRYGVDNPMFDSYISDKHSIAIANSYNSEISKERSGVVYILYFIKLDLIKIGYALDFSKRSVRLLKDFGEFEVIEMIETNECFRLEKAYHEAFNEYRTCVESGEGRTEFFLPSIRDSVKQNLLY